MMDQLRKNSLAWLEYSNPVRGLSISRAQSIFDQARRYGSPRLQYIYNEIEATNPVLFTCTERRASALGAVGWRFAARASADATLADEQRDALDAFCSQIDNLTEAIEHLDLGFFRGFAHVQPIWEGDEVRHVNLLDSWNFLRDDFGNWYWNPGCRESLGGLQPCDKARLVTVTRRRAVDYPALFIHIRHALGERDWGRFVERYGIPPVHVVMGPGATKEDEAKYQATVDAARDGSNAAWPSGSTIHFAEGARGTDPFTPFVKEQEKQILILATGGTLATLAESGAGTLAGNAQDKVWQSIVCRDGAVISDALNRSLFRPFLEAKFPGRPVAAEFKLGSDKPMDAGELFDLAGKAKAAGYLIGMDELSEATGYTLVKDEAQNAPGGFGGMQLNKAEASKDDPGPASSVPSGDRELLDAFAKDTGPAAERVKALLDDPTPEAAKKLLDDLPTLLPKEPDLAAVIADAMAAEFAAALTTEKNKQGVCPKCRQFLDENGNCTNCRGTEAGAPAGAAIVAVGSTNTDSPEEQSRHIAKAAAAFEKCLSEQVDVPAAFHRSDIGDIDLRWGKRNKGLQHMVARRDAFAKAHPGAPDGKAVIAKMPETIIKGKVTEVTHSGGHPNIVIEHGGYRAIITRDREGGNHWFISGYDISDEGRGYRAKRK